MPLNLITGLPGHGKGVYSLWNIEQLRKQSNRPVYYHNITDLKLPWLKLEDPKRWHDLPEGSIIVFDEAWQTFPLRPNAQIPPEHVGLLAVHRHKGFDIFIITQDIKQIDSFVRNLIDKHFHIIRKFGSQVAKVHQFVGKSLDPSKQKRDSIKSDFKFKKEVYGWYKSAEVHTVQTKRPFRIYMLWFGLPLIIAAALFFVFKKLNPYGGDIANGLHKQIDSVATQQDSTLNNESKSAIQKGKEILGMTYVQLHAPEIKDFPQTAPVYKDIIKPVVAPYPAACVIMRGQCKCFTQQATHLDTTDSVCRQIVEKGFFIEWEQKSIDSGRVIASNKAASNGVSGRSPDVDQRPSRPINWGSASTASPNS